MNTSLAQLSPYHSEPHGFQIKITVSLALNPFIAVTVYGLEAS